MRGVKRFRGSVGGMQQSMKRRRFVQGMLTASAMVALPAADGAAVAGDDGTPAPRTEQPTHRWLLDTAAFVDAESSLACAHTLADAQWLRAGAFLDHAALAPFGGSNFTAVLSPANAVLLHSLVRGRGLIEVLEDREQARFYKEISCGSELARDVRLSTLAHVLSVQLAA